MSADPVVQARLARALKARVVALDCGDRPQLGLRLPLQGLIVAPGRVVTAFGVIEGWPDRCSGLTVVGGDGRRRAAAVGLRDAQIGLALLDVPGLEAGAVAADEAPGVGAAQAGGHVAAGAVLYAVRGEGLVRVPVLGRASAERAYYWRVVGAPLPLGAPLFDGTGSLASVVGVASDDPELAGYALPSEALTGLFERAMEWAP